MNAVFDQSLLAKLAAVSLATGLYSVHCLIPPHPGASAAAVSLGVDFGKFIMLGIVVAGHESGFESIFRGNLMDGITAFMMFYILSFLLT